MKVSFGLTPKEPMKSYREDLNERTKNLLMALQKQYQDLKNLLGIDRA